MPVTLVTGNLGSGKTLIMSILGYADYKADERPVYSNYGLAFPHKMLNMGLIKSLFKEKHLKVADYLIDELPLFCDSRRSGSEKNILIMGWVMQTRKRKVNLIGTGQFYGMFDVRLRNVCQTRVECVNFGTYENPDLEFTISKRAEVGDELFFVPVKRFRLSDPKRFYELYDTDETIDPFMDE